MRLRGAAIGLVLQLVFVPFSGSTQEVNYRGLCDASAAVALGADHFIVADDENDVLVVYRRGAPDPVASVDVIDYLGNRKPSGKVKEADLEGAARIGDTIYWMASHSRNKRARQKLFATTIVETGPVPTVRPVSAPPYTSLLQDLLAEPKLAALRLAEALNKEPESPGGFNIEGLAATPEGHLLIGFRNPVINGKALIVPVTNPHGVINAGTKPVFGDPILIDLAGRGIRSIERAGDRYLIIAGPFGPGERQGSDFILYAWSGKADDKPVALRTDFGQLNPEAFFALPGGNEIQILSDDGDVTVGRKKCKSTSVHPANKSFRSITWPVP